MGRSRTGCQAYSVQTLPVGAILGLPAKRCGVDHAILHTLRISFTSFNLWTNRASSGGPTLSSIVIGAPTRAITYWSLSSVIFAPFTTFASAIRMRPCHRTNFSTAAFAGPI